MGELYSSVDLNAVLGSAVAAVAPTFRYEIAAATAAPGLNVPELHGNDKVVYSADRFWSIQEDGTLEVVVAGSSPARRTIRRGLVCGPMQKHGHGAFYSLAPKKEGHRRTLWVHNSKSVIVPTATAVSVYGTLGMSASGSIANDWFTQQPAQQALQNNTIYAQQNAYGVQNAYGLSGLIGGGVDGGEQAQPLPALGSDPGAFTYRKRASAAFDAIALKTFGKPRKP